METDYKKNQEISCINYLYTIYIAANDLYGLSMIQNYHIETQNGMMN